MKDIIYLHNPHSHQIKSGRKWLELVDRMPQVKSHSVDITEIPKLYEFLEAHPSKYLAIAGGDGTINLVAQQVLKLRQKPTLAIIPMGLGNALSYCLGVETIEKAVAVLKKPAFTAEIDIVKTNIEDFPIGLFNIGIGFDAAIVHNRSNYRYIGVGSYVISAVRSIFTHHKNEIQVIVDKKVTFNATASSLVIANCPVIGQNLIFSPSAKLNDGLLDCTLFSTNYAYFTNIRAQGFKHPLYTDLGKIHFKAKHIQVVGEPLVQIDGDSVKLTRPLELEILPKEITFLRNSIDNIEQKYKSFL